MIDRMTRDTQGWVDRLLLRDDMPFIPDRLPVRGRRYAGTYDHLARTGEWRRDDDVEDDE
jgi:hypothetical protein